MPLPSIEENQSVFRWSGKECQIFFDSSYPVKNDETYISSEASHRPLSDREIVKELEKRFHIARRTCALYREEMVFLPSYLRKKLKENNFELSPIISFPPFLINNLSKQLKAKARGAENEKRDYSRSSF